MGEKERGAGWISSKKPTQKHECSMGAAGVAQFMATRSRKGIKLNEILETLGD